jgi:uncharacterized protein (TIGR03066 family)
MNALRFAFLGCLISGLIGCGTPTTSSVTPHSGGGSGKTPSTPAAKPEGGTPAATGEKSNKDKIVGTWQPVKEAGASIEYAKDGKLKVTMKQEGKEMTMEGTYAVDGDKLTQTLKPPAPAPEQKITLTIIKLTGTELETKDDKGKVDEFKKK